MCVPNALWRTNELDILKICVPNFPAPFFQVSGTARRHWSLHRWNATILSTFLSMNFVVRFFLLHSVSQSRRILSRSRRRKTTWKFDSLLEKNLLILLTFFEKRSRVFVRVTTTFFFRKKKTLRGRFTNPFAHHDVTNDGFNHLSNQWP